jgi:hypothetical protein
MARSRASVPTYRIHKPTGQAVVTVRTADGARRDVYLGKSDSPESRTEYARVVAELAASPSATAAPTCCLITTSPNEVVKAFHDRMPAILTPEDYAKWFDHDAELVEVQGPLKPLAAELMVVSEANVLANSPRNEGPQLLEPAA